MRVHRASEGAPYTGLKPACRDRGPAIPAADKALESGSTEAVEQLLTGAIRQGVRAHLPAAMRQKRCAPNDVAAGRRYVAAYVPDIPYGAGLWDAATPSAKGPYPAPAGPVR